MVIIIHKNNQEIDESNWELIKEAYIVSQNMSNSDKNIPVCLANLIMIGNVEDIKKVKAGWADLWEIYLSMGDTDKKDKGDVNEFDTEQ